MAEVVSIGGNPLAPLLGEAKGILSTLALSGPFAGWGFLWDLVEDTGPQGEKALRLECRCAPPEWTGEAKPMGSVLLPLAEVETERLRGSELLRRYLARHAHEILLNLVLFVLDESLSIGPDRPWCMEAKAAAAKAAHEQRVLRAKPQLVDAGGRPLR